MAVTLVLSQLMSSSAFAEPGGDLTLASISPAGVKGNDSSFFPTLSGDGRKLTFESRASNLLPADSDFITDIYVRDLVTGDLRLATTSATGTKANFHSSGGVISADGTKVLFSSGAINLDPTDVSTDTDVYVKNLVTEAVALASRTNTGTKSNGASFGSSLSADGTKVAFNTFATNLDPRDFDVWPDNYVKDLSTGALTLVSTSASGAKGDQQSVFPILCADGTKVAFGSNASNLVPADTDGIRDVFMKSLVTGDIVLASTSSAGVKGNDWSVGGSMSGDCSKVAFDSMATNLDPADTEPLRDVYVKDLNTGRLTLVSVSASGVKGNFSSYSPKLSPDGTKVMFESRAWNLHPDDTDSFEDVFVKDLVTGELTLITTTATGTKGNRGGQLGAASSDFKTFTFYSSSTNLDPRDTDERFDVYVRTLRTPDVTPPVITVPSDITVAATVPDGAVVAYAASAVDDRDGAIAADCLPASGSTFPIGLTTVTCVATDGSGNSASSEFLVTVKGSSEQIQDLQGKTASYLDMPVGPAFEAQLRTATRAEDNAKACAALDRYITLVDVVPGGALTAAERAELTADALRIRSVVGCD